MRARLNFASRLVLIGLACGGGAFAVPLPAGAAPVVTQPPRPRGSLAAFSSDAELRTYLRRLKRQQEEDAPPPPPAPVPAPMPAPPPPSPAAPGPAGSVVVTGNAIAQPNLSSSSPITVVNSQEVKLQGTTRTENLTSITNNQEATVDEGDIVKVSGEHLVILRRGRLFTVSLAGGTMRPVDAINAFPPGVSGRGDWYDEMLISGDRIVVVGYSYARGGTEINRFRIDRSGRLRFEDAWHLKSNDYYSSRNYASRLIGNRLIFYTPLYLEWDEDPFEAFPGVRRWRGSDEGAFQRIASARKVYIAPVMRNSRDAVVDTVHSVTSCDLAAAELDCSAIAVLGPASRTFYVSPQAVYLWVSDAWDEDDERRRGPDSWLYRLPFGRERPSAVGARGAPVDQFSFREDGAEGVLNVLLRGESGGDFMFAPEVSGRGVALARVRFSDFGSGSRELPRNRYRVLPEPGPNSWSFQNRFAGPYVLYGGGRYGEARDSAKLIAAPVRGGAVAQLTVPHSVDRIDLLGSDAIAIGEASRGLGFSTVELSGGPRLGDEFLLPDAAEGETRSHAFFFSPDRETPDGASGTLGLPVAKRADPKLARFFGSSAAMLFLRRDQRRLAHAGEIEAQTRGVADDACQASCVDWYGNARPIFLGGRIFALLGYELVEGELARGRIREVGRISFAPPPPPPQQRQ